jgi:hypothetical protein
MGDRHEDRPARASSDSAPPARWRPFTPAAQWLERIDPGTHRRIKGLRLVTAYGIAAMLGAMPDITQGFVNGSSLSTLAGGFALWASVSEGKATRAESSRDLVLLVAAAALGAVSFLLLAPLLDGFGRAGPEVTLAGGAFLVGYLKRFGILGSGLGSQIYIGQLLTYGTKLTAADAGLVAAAAAIAALAAVVPRVLSGPVEHPVTAPTLSAAPRDGGRHLSPELAMGLQACLAALIIVALNETLGLVESAWAITASTYVVTNSALGTVDRARRRIIGTVIGVPLGIACLPIAAHAPLLIWAAAALAMVIYAMALPERYDVACGAFAFTLVVTLAVTGEHSVALLFSRLWETLIGAGLGLVAATMLWPLRIVDDSRA